MGFQRGFKSLCENMAIQVRRRLDLQLTDPLSVESVAELLAIPLWAPSDLTALPLDVLGRLVGEHASAWSAMTVSNGIHTIIICNPAHKPRRRASDVMHELSHVMLRHTPGNMFFGPGGLALRTHEPDQEAEANWLASCLLLPREALLWARRNGVAGDEICTRYAVSREMLQFRLNSTGVDRQVTRGRVLRAGSPSKTAKAT